MFKKIFCQKNEIVIGCKGLIQFCQQMGIWQLFPSGIRLQLNMFARIRPLKIAVPWVNEQSFPTFVQTSVVRNFSSPLDWSPVIPGLTNSQLFQVWFIPGYSRLDLFVAIPGLTYSRLFQAWIIPGYSRPDVFQAWLIPSYSRLD